MGRLDDMYQGFLSAFDEAPFEEQQEFAKRVAVGYWKNLNRAIVEMCPEWWEIKEEGICDECGTEGRLYRLKRGKKYNKTMEKAAPKYRCEECSARKHADLKAQGRL